MSILIKGMEMPIDAPVIIKICPDGSVSRVHEGVVAKAIPIPPHGRLIDADKIGLTDFEIILCQKGNPFKNALEMLFEKIENAPTILEAEKGET